MMIPILFKAALIFCIFSSTNLVQAKSNRTRVTAGQQASDFQFGSWTKGENTVVQLSGHNHQALGECKKFEIRIELGLEFNIECEGYTNKKFFNLKNVDNLTFIKTHNQITITSYNYLIKKPQTSRLEQSSLKIPYVEEIIHIKQNSNGELAFYLENFELDQFARIVNKSIIQLHGLAKKDLSIGQSNKKETLVN